MLAIVATTRWEVADTGRKPETAEIWRRFPKLVIGLLVASALITVVASGYSLADYDKILRPALVEPTKALRTWTFVFCFLSIGLTTRFRELAPAGSKPFMAFSAGVAFNFVLGFVLSVLYSPSTGRD